MELFDYLTAVEESDTSEWTMIDRPVFLQDHQSSTAIAEHYALMSCRRDLSIAIAVGLPHLEEFREDWAMGFPDSAASSGNVTLAVPGGEVVNDQGQGRSRPCGGP